MSSGSTHSGSSLHNQYSMFRAPTSLETAGLARCQLLCCMLTALGLPWYRPGVFFTINSEGAMETWDYYYKQKDPVLTVRCRLHSAALA